MIAKKDAELLFAYDFKLVDKEGNEYEILEVSKSSIRLYNPNRNKSLGNLFSDFSQIGIDYFILAHPYSSLTKQINGVVPIVELAKISFTDEEWYYDVSDNNCFSKNEILCFGYSSVKNAFWCDIKSGGFQVIPNQELLINAFHSLHFLPSGIDQRNVKWIKD